MDRLPRWADVVLVPLISLIRPDNQRSIAVAERLGHHIESARRRVLGLPRPTLPWSSQTPSTT